MSGPVPSRPSGRYRGVYTAFLDQLRQQEREAARTRRRRARDERRRRRAQKERDRLRGYASTGPRAVLRGLAKWSTWTESRAAASSLGGGGALLCYWE